MYVLNECFKWKFRDSRGVRKVCDENKRNKETTTVKKFLMTGRTLYDYHKSNMMDFDELQAKNSSHTKGTICLVNG